MHSRIKLKLGSQDGRIKTNLHSTSGKYISVVMTNCSRKTRSICCHPTG